MKAYIGEDLIKVVFIRTSPGAEFQVAQQLKEACTILGVKKYAILKALGGFDLIFLYPSEFFSHLTFYGPITNILDFNTFLCFPYKWQAGSKNIPDIIDGINQATFSSFSLLKLNNQASPSGKSLEIELFQRIGRGVTDSNKYHILGNLGWDEFIFVLNKDSLNEVTQILFRLFYERFSGKSNENFLAKSLSYVAVNLEQFLGYDWANPQTKSSSTYIKKTTSHLRKLTNQPAFKIPIAPHIEPNISISFQPGNRMEILEYWREEGYLSCDLLGEEDINITYHGKKELSWGKLLFDILLFRFKFSKKIQSTNTVLNCVSSFLDNNIKFDERDFISLKSRPRIEILPIDLDLHDWLGDYFGEASPLLATQLYALNSLYQNPITGSVFDDMLYYPNYISQIGSESYEKGRKPNPSLGFLFAKTLSLACELRSYGIYGHVEKKYGRFSKLKGGIHRPLLALEYIIAKVIERSAPPVRPWFGFLNIWEDRKCWQLHEVVYIPIDDLLNPWNWWTIFHEIAHILIDRNPTIASKKVKVIQTYLVDKHDPRNVLKYFVEVAAEIIGYELGFFGDYDLFLHCVWPYLIDIEETLSEYNDMENYLFRTLLVEIWNECYGTGLNEHGSKIATSIDSFYDEKTLYNKFNSHINRILEILKEELKPQFHLKFRWLEENQEIIVAKWLQDIREFLPFITHLNDKIGELEDNTGVRIRYQQNVKNDPISKKIAKKLFAGEIYWESIEYPDAVLYYLIKDNHKIATREEWLPFFMATVISFWNANLKRMETRRHVSLERP